MLEKLATHDIEDVSRLFSLTHKCARAAEGQSRHSCFEPKAQEGDAAGSSGQGQKKKNNNNKKKKNKPMAGAPTTATAASAG
jgi:hypothetical protein